MAINSLALIAIIFLVTVMSMPSMKKEFVFFTRQSSWNEARCVCTYYAMDFMVLNSQDKLAAFETTFETANIQYNDMWFGLYNSGNKDAASKYIYQWTDSQILGTWEKWGSNEPNYETKDKCVRISGGIWRTMTCESTYSFACEMFTGPCTMEIGKIPSGISTSGIQLHKSEDECKTYCLNETNQHCYGVLISSPGSCNIFTSNESRNFVASSGPVIGTEKFYRKVCFTGSTNTEEIAYTDSTTDPHVTCGTLVGPSASTFSESIAYSTNVVQQSIEASSESSSIGVSLSLSESSISQPLESSLYSNEVWTDIDLSSSETSITQLLDSSAISQSSIYSTAMYSSSSDPSLPESLESSPFVVSQSTMYSAGPTSSLIDSSSVESAISPSPSESSVTDMGSPDQTTRRMPVSTILTTEISPIPLASQIPSISSINRISSLDPSFSDTSFVALSTIPVSAGHRSYSFTTYLTSLDRSSSLESDVVINSSPSVSIITQDASMLCGCRCQLGLIETQQQQEEMVQVVKELTIEKNTTSKFRRKLISVLDSRPSANAIGAMGIAIFVIVATCILLPDVLSLARYIYLKR